MKTPEVELHESAGARIQRIMAAAMAAKKPISVRLNAQIKDPDSATYKGLPGYSIVFRATSPRMVELAFTAIEEALKKL